MISPYKYFVHVGGILKRIFKTLTIVILAEHPFVASTLLLVIQIIYFIDLVNSIRAYKLATMLFFKILAETFLTFIFIQMIISHYYIK